MMFFRQLVGVFASLDVIGICWDYGIVATGVGKVYGRSRKKEEKKD